MIRYLQFPPNYDVIPQAIFWRPLSYFTTLFREDEDGLDVFQAASFTIGNEICFDLRKYRGHPDQTATMYLSAEINIIVDILNIINKAVDGMAVPEYAVAWRRGWNFEFGSLRRRDNDRLREPEARILALKIAAQCEDHAATTEYIKQQLPRYMQLSREDLLPSESRPREQRWQQIIGNVVSHRESPAGPFKKGYAVRTENGLKVTKEGLVYLSNMGFSVA